MLSNVASTQRRPSGIEVFRVLVLVVAAVAVTSAFLTPYRMGGVDALWYAYMVRGITDQIASGHFPVPMGEGICAWNGGIHPFRSAPVFPVVVALWDAATLGKLGPFTLQHLAVLTSSVAGTIGFYVGARKIMPDRRWAAAAFAFLYLATPAWLSIVNNAEDYMSYMAFAAMPLVLYGNARSTLGNDGRGYVPLGAGLAIVWMCHPPIAFITSITTLFIQVGAATSRGFGAWKGMIACAVTFAVLGAYYFLSMSELPPSSTGVRLPSEMVTVLALALFFLSLGRWAVNPRNLGWLVLALAAAWAVGHASRPWLLWIAASAFYWFVAAAMARWVIRFPLSRHAFPIMFACGLLGAATVEAILGPNHPGIFTPALLTLATNTATFPACLSPLPWPLESIGLIQPGWALDLMIVAGALSLIAARPLGAKAFFAASLGLCLCYVRVPLVSNFLDGYFPAELTAMCGIPLGLRIMPVIASFAAMAGVLWLATLPPRSRWAPPVLAILALSVGWSGWQATRFVRIGHAVTSGKGQTDQILMPENVALARYAYDLMHLPAYYSNGVIDPSLETRLLDGTGSILVGPDQEEEALEAAGVRHVRLECKPIPNSRWFDVVPDITLGPGEHVLLRFEFDPRRAYNGFMILTAEHLYREYHLPDSGLDKAFGIGGSRTHVLSLSNTADTAEHYHFSVSREPGNDVNANGGLFANLSIAKYVPDALPVRLESMIPYKATVSSATGGWLETFVLFLPGYRATVDGIPADIAKSDESLNKILVPPGTHTVEIHYVGTLRLWLSAVVSGAGFLAFGLLWLKAAKRGTVTE
jgi:hypothetical protein